MANRKYDQQLKDSVIKEVIIGERSAAQVARDHEIPESAVYSWIRAHKEKNDLAVLQYKNETPEQEIQRLKAELKKAQMERDILKKATAYFANLEK
jgi:transposase